jgi:hypothetical protein
MINGTRGATTASTSADAIAAVAVLKIGLNEIQKIISMAHRLSAL